ncbi:hypothetical protein HAX54_014303, partial [Datura stramonium]|nr:hypothetical protein [Datura stramonium]
FRGYFQREFLSARQETSGNATLSQNVAATHIALPRDSQALSRRVNNKGGE